MTTITKARNNTVPNLNFGLTLMWRGQKVQISGISPSPTFKNELELLKEVVAFVNKKLGTNYKIVQGKV